MRTLTLRMAFNDAAAVVKIVDADAAWKLATDDLRAVEVAEDGSVGADRVGEIAAYVAQRYPYLVATPAPTAEAQALQDKFPALTPSGSSTEKRRKPNETLNRAAVEKGLRKKFPALRHR